MGSASEVLAFAQKLAGDGADRAVLTAMCAAAATELEGRLREGVSPDVMLKLLRCAEFQNPLTGLNFQGTGELSNPLGAKLIKTSALGSGKLIGLDKGYALEMISSGDVSVEYDRLIDRQLERAAITSTSGFAKLYTGASAVLSV